MELGVNIDLIETANAPGLFSLEPIINRGDSTKRLFIAMEGSFERPQELVVIIARGLCVIDIEHVVGMNRKPAHEEIMDQKHVHGLLFTPAGYTSRIKMIKLLGETISEESPLKIVFWDDTLSNFIPSFQGRMVRLHVPHWKIRMSHYSHQAALHFKSRDIDRHLHKEVSGHSHAQYEGLRERPLSSGDFHQQNYGYKCALISAYELMHYHMASPATKIKI